MINRFYTYPIKGCSIFNLSPMNYYTLGFHIWSCGPSKITDLFATQLISFLLIEPKIIKLLIKFKIAI